MSEQRMNIDEALAVITEAQWTFHEKAKKACREFYEKHGEYPMHIGICNWRRIRLLEPVVVLEPPDAPDYTRITVPFKRYRNMKEDDMFLWHPLIGNVPLKHLGA